MIRSNDPMLLIGAVWVATVLMLGLIWTGVRIRSESWPSIGLRFGHPRWSDVGWSLLKSIPIFLFAVGAFILGAIVMANIVGIPDVADMTQYNYLRGNLPMLLIRPSPCHWPASQSRSEACAAGRSLSGGSRLMLGRSGTCDCTTLEEASIATMELARIHLMSASLF
ncbi:MAG: hypothetical protein BMS9Abin37_2875 [Acidobacteriota bacterium]|nr:MAG: hypothetical protein BMS9Abin37_2875 [Acidobacteriota bacterium]